LAKADTELEKAASCSSHELANLLAYCRTAFLARAGVGACCDPAFFNLLSFLDQKESKLEMQQLHQILTCCLLWSKYAASSKRQKLQIPGRASACFFQLAAFFFTKKTASQEGNNFRHFQLAAFFGPKRQQVENAATSDCRDRLSVPFSTCCIFLPKKEASSKCSNFSSSRHTAFFGRTMQ
jgi:hypothetical protein